MKLRALLRRKLDDNPAQIPPHIAQKVEERISRALKKNASMDAGQYTTVAGMLEYFDLREIQDTIVSKPLWLDFEASFANKESLATKFDQLAELRNGIRHSRSVSEVTRMEGEASILWFDQSSANRGISICSSIACSRKRGLMKNEMNRISAVDHLYSGDVGELAVAVALLRAGLLVAKPYWDRDG